MSPPARLLAIAGSDPSGGAGLQADLKTCAAFGVYGMTAVTAITVQNTLGVSHVEVLSADLVVAQIRAVLEDMGTDVIKIGMLGRAETVEAVADVLDELAPETPIVLDPVMLATSGGRLLEEKAVNTLKQHLLPMADLITPNVDEAEILTGIRPEDTEGLKAAGDKLLEMGAGAALMKGGHVDGAMITDVLVSPQGQNIMISPRLHSRHTHGTGCTLATAVACGLALGLEMEAAVHQAREYVYEAIKNAPNLGAGHGPLGHNLAGPDTGREAEQTEADNPFSVLKNL